MIEFAKSLAGHDAGVIYLIINSDDEYVYLVDGSIRKLVNPKKKKRKHIQLIKKIPIEIIDILKEEPIDDVKIKRALRIYKDLTVKSMED